MKKKILVAMDGLYCSLNEIHYLSRIFANHDDISVHLVSIVSSGSLPAGSDWMEDADKMNMLSSAARKRLLLAKKHQREETGHLLRNGFTEEQVSGTVRLSRTDAAFDLIFEARKGKYDALLVGRRGLGRLQEIVLGSVTRTILEKCFDMPIWVIDGKIDSRRFLVSVDGTRHALRAVDHLSFILENVAEAEIILYHSKAWLKEKKPVDLEKFNEIWGKDWCDTHLTRPDHVFHGPEQILRENGFDMEKIKRVEESKGLEPARDIFLQVRDNDIGTVVMGRRGPEDPKNILGGVSERVLHTVNDVAVWLVN